MKRRGEECPFTLVYSKICKNPLVSAPLDLLMLLLLIASTLPLLLSPPLPPPLPCSSCLPSTRRTKLKMTIGLGEPFTRISRIEFQ